MKTRMIAVTAGILLAAASLIPMAGAETVTNTEGVPPAITETVASQAAKDVVTGIEGVPPAITETVTNTEGVPPAVTETTPAETAEKETVTTPAEAAETAAAAEEETAETETAKLVVADVKTHHRFTEVANPFQVKAGKVSRKTKVCLWSTDSRRSNTKIRRLSADETLTVVAQSDGWFKVVDSNGVTGFVLRSHVTRV